MNYQRDSDLIIAYIEKMTGRTVDPTTGELVISYVLDDFLEGSESSDVDVVYFGKVSHLLADENAQILMFDAVANGQKRIATGSADAPIMVTHEDVMFQYVANLTAFYFIGCKFRLVPLPYLRMEGGGAMRMENNSNIKLEQPEEE